MFTFRRPSSFAVAPEWGEAQAEKARKVFDEFDRDSNQKIDYKELVPALKEYGVELPENVQAIDFVRTMAAMATPTALYSTPSSRRWSGTSPSEVSRPQPPPRSACPRRISSPRPTPTTVACPR